MIGEEAGIGACSGNLMIALPLPLPTIAPVHAARACSTVVASSWPARQIGRPTVSTAPWRSNSMSIVSRIGGSSPFTVEILPPPWIVIGAFSWRGSLVGEKPPSAVMMMLPARSLIASALLPIASTASAASATTTNFLRFTPDSPLPVDPSSLLKHR